MTNVLVWSDNQGPQAAWIIPDTPDPDAPVPQAAWSEGGPFLSPATVMASKGGQSWREWAKHLESNPSPVGGAFTLFTVSGTVTDPQEALQRVRLVTMEHAAGAG